MALFKSGILPLDIETRRQTCMYSTRIFQDKNLDMDFLTNILLKMKNVTSCNSVPQKKKSVEEKSRLLMNEDLIKHIADLFYSVYYVMQIIVMLGANLLHVLSVTNKPK